MALKATWVVVEIAYISIYSTVGYFFSPFQHFARYFVEEFCLEATAGSWRTRLFGKHLRGIADSIDCSGLDLVDNGVRSREKELFADAISKLKS